MSLMGSVVAQEIVLLIFNNKDCTHLQYVLGTLDLFNILLHRAIT